MVGFFQGSGTTGPASLLVSSLAQAAEDLNKAIPQPAETPKL